MLEIGCGSGEVAAELTRAGIRVVALDQDSESVAAAGARGVDARTASWPASLPETCFDAIAFTRSIHHISDLSAAVERAAELLPVGGTLAVEDFDYRGADPRFIQWAAARFAALAVPLDPGSFAARLARTGDPLALWRADHDEHLRDFVAIETEVRRRLEIVERSTAPYLFRYLEAAGITEEAVLDGMARDEIAAAADLSVSPLGHRLVSRRR